MNGTPVELVQAFVPPIVIGGILYLLIANLRRFGRASSADDDTRDGPELCVHCGYDIRGEFERCPECGRPTPAARRHRLADLRTRWPTEAMSPRSPGVDETPVVVLTTDEWPAADLLRQHLEARGIAARLGNPQPIGHAAYQQVMGGHKLVVWSDDAERARAIIAKLWGDVAGQPPPGAAA